MEDPKQMEAHSKHGPAGYPEGKNIPNAWLVSLDYFL